ncbi:gibberellin 20-oxidase-like protein [Rutidosis leptorrhynchoides]|uniref:gibberellin 20-oxidase-like protein n=1 Tax=Rutidosis leptorrhynchoides TaxID=125765 RepID=UPI003A995E54
MPASQTSIQLPVFDISKPISASSLSSLSLACKEWGFFHIINHGISKDLYRKIRVLSNELFSLPYELKLKAGPTSNVKTYTPQFIASPFFESLRVSGPDYCNSAQSSAAALSNKPTLEFSEVVGGYGDKMRILSKKIAEILLMCLGEDFEKAFEPEFSNCEGYIRINNYSLPEKRIIGKDVEGLGMHTDMSCLTIVYQDDVGGLQVRSKDGKWLDINPCEETLVVNIGDLLHAWSNGKLRSSEHRVILKESKKKRNRFSLAFFWCFENDKVIYSPNEVVGDDFRAYEPFLCGDYLKFRENSERGKFEKVGHTVKDFAGIGG